MKTTRLDGESAKAYAAFRAYAEMGAQRSQEAVARKLTKSRQIVARWSVEFHWKERIIQWDLEDAERQNKAKEKVELELAREKAKRREQVQDSAWEMFRKLREKADAMLNFPVGRQTKSTEKKDGKTIETTIIEPVRWRFSDLAKLIEVADSLGRLANGMPSRVTGLSDPEGKPFTMPVGTAPTIVNVHVRRDKDSDAAAELFGREPARNARK